jgi:hypothetical protein
LDDGFYHVFHDQGTHAWFGHALWVLGWLSRSFT